ncbi:hypothetical protein Ahu01nite_042380 [Winogradskya humida]|uniref:Uncharacterized protein n=1 Tax=Winogradskya humida TaxID=113566 RepID=A0ABQ3ZRD5_9ACTN|nr:hypothetical protein Ahu01nite_042380 [Actinoplanes humidus]
MTVKHGGHEAGPARAAGTTLAELGTGLGADLYLGHGETPETLIGLRLSLRATSCAIGGAERSVVHNLLG